MIFMTEETIYHFCEAETSKKYYEMTFQKSLYGTPKCENFYKCNKAPYML